MPIKPLKGPWLEINDNDSGNHDYGNHITDTE